VVKLEHSPLFCPLPPAELKQICAAAQERSFADGQDIFKEGDNGDGIYIVKEGLVEISGVLDQNVRHVFSEVQAGDVFGEMAVIEQKPRSASAIARGATIVYFISRADILSLVERSPMLALSLLREISHRLREFNQRHLREVLQADRLAIIGRFARSIVHDLKNPLNIIGLTSEIVGMPQVSPEMRNQALATIRQQVERISDLVGDILDFTQGGPGPQLVLPPMNFRLYLEHLLEEMHSEAKLKGITIELGSPPPDVSLLFHPKRLRRVLYNLVHNATEAMPGGGKITFRFETRPGELVTEIEDTGPGIAPDVVTHLFQPFATHGKENGTGLGLSICKRIIEDHHGWIAARNEPGRGAVFSFALPLPKLEEI
jgi:signal transduction histidine kinase